MNYQEADKKSYEVEWKVDTCNSGEACWCRTIMPIEPIPYDDGRSFYIVGDAALDVNLAEYIVKLYNESLKNICNG